MYNMKRENTLWMLLANFSKQREFLVIKHDKTKSWDKIQMNNTYREHLFVVSLCFARNAFTCVEQDRQQPWQSRQYLTIKTNNKSNFQMTCCWWSKNLVLVWRALCHLLWFSNKGRPCTGNWIQVGEEVYMSKGKENRMGVRKEKTKDPDDTQRDIRHPENKTVSSCTPLLSMALDYLLVVWSGDDAYNKTQLQGYIAWICSLV